MNQTFQPQVRVGLIQKVLFYGRQKRFVAVGLLPNEKLIFFSNRRLKAVGSSLESIPINFSNAKSGYATVFAICLFNHVYFAPFITIYKFVKVSGNDRLVFVEKLLCSNTHIKIVYKGISLILSQIYFLEFCCSFETDSSAY